MISSGLEFCVAEKCPSTTKNSINISSISTYWCADCQHAPDTSCAQSSGSRSIQRGVGSIIQLGYLLWIESIILINKGINLRALSFVLYLNSLQTKLYICSISK